jgi:hypothetical protein
VGQCASLFSSSDAEKQTLHRRISPTDEQIASQQEYWNDLADYLKADLRERSGCPVTTWIQGSYKFATQIRPARKGLDYDIDLGVYFAWKGSADDGDHSAGDLKDMVQESLATYADDANTDATGVSDAKEFCSRIRFSDDFHIDVPAYHEWDDVRRLASTTDGFIDRDPYTIWEWWISTFDEAERPRARRMVRYLKMWSALKFDPKTETPPSSILLTVLIAYAYASIDLAGIKGDDELLGALVARIRADLDAAGDDVVANPVDASENLNRLGDSFGLFTTRLKEFEVTCARALKAGDLATAADIWSEEFEHFFPLPNAEEVKKLDEAAGRALVAAFVPEVEITVRLPTGRSYQLRNNATNIPKGSTLDFRLANAAAAPIGATTRWVVRNEGAAAEAANDLGHFGGMGFERKGESAEYRGRHFMDVTVMAHGRLIGMRRVPVSIVSTSVTGGSMKRLFRKK